MVLLNSADLFIKIIFKKIIIEKKEIRNQQSQKDFFKCDIEEICNKLMYALIDIR